MNTHPTLPSTLICLALFGAGEAEAGPKIEPALSEVVRDFAKGGDNRDLGALERVLHADFRVVLSMPKKPVSSMNRAQYLGLIKAGKIGGKPRSVKILWTQTKGDLGFVSATLAGGPATFDTVYTLVRENGRWRIIQDAVRFSPG